MTLQALIDQAGAIWSSGGWAMFALAANALLLFYVGTNLLIHLKTGPYRRVPEKKWRRWIEDPSLREGAVGELIETAMSASSLDDLGEKFRELHTTQLASFNRDLKFMKRAVSTAPLLGLLGTVTGMLSTFTALASDSGAQKTMDMVAGGISEALITTETGLVIALPGLVYQFLLTRERDKYRAFLTHLETVCAQALYRNLRGRRQAA